MCSHAELHACMQFVHVLNMNFSFDLPVNLNESVPDERWHCILLIKHSHFLINKHNYILCVNI